MTGDCHRLRNYRPPSTQKNSLHCKIKGTNLCLLLFLIPKRLFSQHIFWHCGTYASTDYLLAIRRDAMS